MEGGKTWVRVKTIGKGSYSTVSLAKSRTRKKTRTSTSTTNTNTSFFPSVMAVKSAEISDSCTLQKEREILRELEQCPYILRCYGEEFTDEKNGDMVYNLLLEYASGGTLAEVVKNSNNAALSELEIRRYTKSILRGLNYIHENGYVHLDIKPQNILLVPCLNNKKRKRNRGLCFDAKIGDFGCAKRLERSWKEGWKENACLIGTPQYMSPEAITHYKQEPAADIWALGCVVAEMVSGKPALCRRPGEDVDSLLYRIGSGLESPKIPIGMSKEGQDFLKRCFVRNSEFRWTAEMLLLHPFVGVDNTSDDIEETGEFAIATPTEVTRFTSFLAV